MACSCPVYANTLQIRDRNRIDDIMQERRLNVAIYMLMIRGILELLSLGPLNRLYKDKRLYCLTFPRRNQLAQTMESSDWFLIQEAPLVNNNNSHKTLDDFNDEESLRRLVPLVFLGVNMIAGVIGNSIVLIVYPLRFPRNTHRTLIIGLSVADLLVCLIAISFEIVEMRFQYTFYNKIACTIVRSFSYWFTLVSMFVFMGMSYEKYKRICKPMKKQMTVKDCRVYIICVFTIALLLVWPNLLLTGIRMVKLGDNLTGYDCSLSDKYAHTAFHIIAESTLLVVSVILIGIIILLYSLTGRTILIQYRFRKQFRNCSTNSAIISNGQSRNIFTLTDSNKAKRDNHAVTSSKKLSKGVTKDPQHSIRRLTRIAFVVSVVFILSFLPHVMVSLLTAIKGKFLFKPGPVVSAVMPILARSFIINNCANPIIYGFMDTRFGKNSQSLFMKVLFCRNS